MYEILPYVISIFQDASLVFHPLLLFRILHFLFYTSKKIKIYPACMHHTFTRSFHFSLSVELGPAWTFVYTIFYTRIFSRLPSFVFHLTRGLCIISLFNFISYISAEFLHAALLKNINRGNFSEIFCTLARYALKINGHVVNLFHVWLSSL
jgi:hypothetical protein